MAVQKPKQPNQQQKQPKKSRWSWLYYVIMIGLMGFFIYMMYNQQAGKGRSVGRAKTKDATDLCIATSSKGK